MPTDGLLPVVLWVTGLLVLLFVLRIANVLRYIPNNQVGIVEKLWSQKGSIQSGFIALRGEAGFEPEVLRGGLHVFFPFMYRIHRSDLVTVGQGKIAYVFARDGAPLGASQVLGANDTDDKSDFQNVRRFLLGGGQKGPQRKILREGTYAINTTQFAIITHERVYGHALSNQERVILDGMKQTIEDRYLRYRSGNGQSRLKLHADIAHPINARTRADIERRVFRAYEQEVERSQQPGYVPPSLDHEDLDSFDLGIPAAAGIGAAGRMPSGVATH